MVVQVEQYGFDQYVTVMSQNAGMFEDYNSSQNMSAIPTRVYQATFGQKFFFPATSDVLVTYKPEKNHPGPAADHKTFTGQFKLRAWWQQELSDSDRINPDVVVDAKYKAKEAENCTEYEQMELCESFLNCRFSENQTCVSELAPADNKTLPYENETAPSDSPVPLNCSLYVTDSSCSQPEIVVNGTAMKLCIFTNDSVCTANPDVAEVDHLDGDAVPWYEQKLFEVDGKYFTTGSLVILVCGVLVVVLIISAIMSYLAYMKREEIKT